MMLLIRCSQQHSRHPAARVLFFAQGSRSRLRPKFLPQVSSSCAAPAGAALLHTRGGAASTMASLRSTTRRIAFLASALAASSSAAALGVLANPAFSTSASAAAARKSLVVATWNVAAINNNPFEYWIEHSDPRYGALMKGVESFMNDPAEDVDILSVFSQKKYDELEELMAKQPAVSPQLLQEVREKRWPDLKKRKIVSGFLKDAEIGKKRLASMPDRLTNTIAIKGETTASGDALRFLRPTPINCYPERFKDFEDWWVQWKQFIFETQLPNKKNIFSLLKPIPRSKYPELTEDDERVSLPLQVVSIAVFDAILVHMLEKIGKGAWQDLRSEMCQALNARKNERILEILTTSYDNSDVICLQEVASAFAARAGTTLGGEFWLNTPSSSKALSREQNSVILTKKSFFKEAPVDVSSSLNVKDAPVEDGDLLVVRGRGVDGNKYILASFHGDTDGLATIPVLRAVVEFAKQEDGILIFGLDANAYDKFKKGKQLDVREFNREFRALGLTSCFGNEIDPNNYTTYNARTFLQPQLNKAARREEFLAKGDVNPKDFILTFEKHAGFMGTFKDNTGEKRYVEGMVFPTLAFPSDHGVVGTTLELNSDKVCTS